MTSSEQGSQERTLSGLWDDIARTAIKKSFCSCTCCDCVLLEQATIAYQKAAIAILDEARRAFANGKEASVAYISGLSESDIRRLGGV